VIDRIDDSPRRAGSRGRLHRGVRVRSRISGPVWFRLRSAARPAALAVALAALLVSGCGLVRSIPPFAAEPSTETPYELVEVRPPATAEISFVIKPVVLPSRGTVNALVIFAQFKADSASEEALRMSIVAAQRLTAVAAVDRLDRHHSIHLIHRQGRRGPSYQGCFTLTKTEIWHCCLQISIPPLRYGCRKTSEVMQGEKVSLVGYPGYAPGAETFVVTATITERRPISGRSCYILSEQVVPGQSGGPILDVHGYVVGVSQRGRTTNSRGEREGMDSGIGLRELLRFVEDARAARVI